MASIFGSLKTYLYMALCSEIVNLVGLRLLNNANKIGCVRHVSIMKNEPLIFLVRILIKMFDAAGIE